MLRCKLLSRAATADGMTAGAAAAAKVEQVNKPRYDIAFMAECWVVDREIQVK